MEKYLNKYYDLKVTNFAKYNFWKNMKRWKVCPEVNNKLKQFYKTVLQNLKIFNKCLHFPCRMSVNYFKNILFKIYPTEIFGTKYNFLKFFDIIKKICTATFYENVTYKSLLKGWRMSDVHWMQNETLENKEAVLIEVIIWFANIFKTQILKKLFYVQRSLKSYKINYFPMNDYQRLRSKSINAMIKDKQLLPYDNALKRQCKTKLHIIPKAHMTSHRPLVHTKLLRDIKKKDVMPLLKNKGACFNKNLYLAWSKFVKATKEQSIYGIKIDLKDAFSNVNIEKLKPFIKKFLKKIPTSRDAILNSIENQTIQVNKNQIFQWNRGLMQGMRFSSQLCDLSRSFFDRIYLQPFMNKNNFFFRSTDDYFFCSTNRNDVLSVKNILEQNSIVSEEKTQTNLEENSRILFNGRVFNLATKEIEIYVNSDLQTYRYKSKLFYKKNRNNTYKYLREIGGLKINTYNFDKLLLNVNFNSTETVLQNYFKAMIIVAFKIECAIKERFENVPEYLYKFVMELVSYYMRHTRNRLIKTKIHKTEPMNVRRKELKYIGVKAFILVFQKRYLSYKNTILALKSYIKNNKNTALGNKFSKFPPEFNNIRMKRVLPEYK